MFEKFTERSRTVMQRARAEAQLANSEFIGTEHLLLGILDEGGGVAAKILKSLNLAKAEVLKEVQKRITPPTNPPITLGQLPFSPRSKRVIELAGECADGYGHEVIGTEHILIGLVKENEGIAADVLKAMLPGLNLVQIVEKTIGTFAYSKGQKNLNVKVVDLDVLTVLRLYLEKYEKISEDDRKLVRQFFA
jgi:ATP-dependent Clp protease ATP-binding subunit ClpC